MEAVRAPGAGRKVAVYLPSLQGRGAERVGLFMAEALLEAGFDVEIPVAVRRGALVDHPVARAHVVDLGAPNEMLSLPSLLRYIDGAKPDILIAVIHTAKIMAGFAQKLRPQLKLIISVHHDLLQPRHRRFWTRALFGYALERWLYKGVQGAHVVSRALGPQVQSCFGLDAGRIAAIYNPLPEGLEAPDVLPGHAAIFDRPVLTTAGQMVAQKDQAALLEAFHRAGLGDRARLLILGQGPLRAALQRQAARLKLDVAMPGFVPDVRPYMRRSAGFLLSSRSEGLANVLLEAIACGIPVASFDCPVGPREVLADGRIGRLVPPGDIDGLAAAMRDMLAGKLTACAEAEIAGHLADFRPAEVKRRYVELVCRHLDGPAAPG